MDTEKCLRKMSGAVLSAIEDINGLDLATGGGDFFTKHVKPHYYRK